ncbi:CU044_2847 family protein [Actinosynnema sp. CA-299493]
MAELMQMDTANDSFVLVEVDDSDPGFQRASRQGAIIKATETFENALDNVKNAALSALDRMTSGPRQPDSIEIEFGVKMNAEAGAIIAKTSIEGHLKVKMIWQRAGLQTDANNEEPDD